MMNRTAGAEGTTALQALFVVREEVRGTRDVSSEYLLSTKLKRREYAAVRISLRRGEHGRSE